MLKLFSIAGEINLDGTEKANKELDQLDKKGKGLGSKLGSAAKKVGAAGALVGGTMAGVGAAAFGMATKVSGAFDDISKGAQRAGVSTDFYQEMDYWASQNGLSHDRMEKAVGRFNQRMGQAMDGSDKYASALDRMGINLDDVRNGTLSTEDAFAQSIQSLSQMENQQEQVALATEMFGTRLARDMLPALQDGALSMDDARAKAQELGIVIGEDSLAAGVAFTDTWDSLKRSMTTAGQQIMSQLMPTFQKLMDWVIAHMPQIQVVIETVFSVVQTVFGTVIGVIQNVIGWLQTFFTSNQETMNGIWTTIQEVFTNVVTFLQETWANIQAFWEEHGQAILENVQTVFNAIWGVIETVFNVIKDIITQVLSYIVPWIQEKLEMIKQFYEENGKTIAEAVKNVFNFIRSIIEFVMPLVTTIIEKAWNIIRNVFDTVIGVVMGLVKVFARLLTGDFEGVKDALIGIWESLWNGIKGIVAGAWDLLKGVFSTLWDMVGGWFTGLVDDALGWGKDLITGFWDGIKSMGSWIAKKITGFIKDKIPGPIKKVLGIASPSKLMMEYGEDTGEGLALGMEDKQNRIGKVSDKLANAIAQPVDIGARTVQQQAPSITNNLSLGSVESLLTELIQAVRENKNILIDDGTLTDAVNNRNAVNAIVGGYMD